MTNRKKILITGSSGFIGSNVLSRLKELNNFTAICFNRKQGAKNLNSILNQVDAVIHLAGVNRPKDQNDFSKGNAELTEAICEAIKKTNRKILFILASSTQIELDNHYGTSKLLAENSAKNLARKNGSPVVIFRLPGVFGKWCKPNYNSVVATFCYNIARGLPIEIHDQNKKLNLVFIDDVVSAIIESLKSNSARVSYTSVEPEYSITLGELAKKIEDFARLRKTNFVDKTGSNFTRALYSTYISYLPIKDTTFNLTKHEDARGVFVEILKTMDTGQISVFSAHPGVTRGQHYHNTKTEKFVVVKGKALFKFRNILTDETYEIESFGDKPKIIETIPGWSHSITNTGNKEMFVIVWANEVFDVESPDTIPYKV